MTQSITQFCFKPLQLMALCIPVIQGCSTLGIGDSDYACNSPGKGVCKSARQVYRDTDASTIEENPSASVPQFPAVITFPPDPSPFIVTPEALPHRLPAQVLKIWIAPWVDKQGNWHSGGFVMTDIYPREWQSAVPVYSTFESK